MESTPPATPEPAPAAIPAKKPPRKKKATGKRRGRPPGSKSKKVEVRAEPSRCNRCGSTDRTPYSNTRVLAFAGRDAHGQPFTHVVWRRTRCQNCGQHRVDKSFENRIKA